MKLFVARLLFFLIVVVSPVLTRAASKMAPLNHVSIDFPIQGGAMLTIARSYRLTRFVEAGVMVSGGRIDREFDLDVPGNPDARAETQSWVGPFIGPRLSLTYNFVGISLAYGFFYADTDMTVRNVAGGDLTGTTKGWGSGFYSPLLVLDFYDKKRDMIFGFGLGGFFGTSGPDLRASSSSVRLKTDESPIDSLTVHFRMLWAAKRQPLLPQPDDDF